MRHLKTKGHNHEKLGLIIWGLKFNYGINHAMENTSDVTSDPSFYSYKLALFIGNSKDDTSINSWSIPQNIEVTIGKWQGCISSAPIIKLTTYHITKLEIRGNTIQEWPSLAGCTQCSLKHLPEQRLPIQDSYWLEEQVGGLLSSMVNKTWSDAEAGHRLFLNEKQEIKRTCLRWS